MIHAKRVLPIFLALALTPAGASGQMDVHLRTERPGGGLIPIIVRDVTATDDAVAESARYLEKVLRNDLVLTDVFDPVDLPAGADTLPGGQTASAIVEGSLEWDGERYMLEARLLDFTSRETIFDKRYTFGHTALRTVAHSLCNEILFFLAGETGIAGTRILFTRREGDVKSLFLIDWDGYGERRITRDELVVSPCWLDSDSFCFTSYRRENPDCYLVVLSEGKRRLISHRKGLNVAGSYDPGSGEIAATLSLRGNSELYLMRTDGSLVRRLTDSRAIEVSPTWSPNGRELAFVSDRTRTPQIYIMDRFGGNVRRLTVEGGYNTSPDWSPDGDLIAYSAREGGLYRLRLISPDGFWVETVFDDFLSYEDPCWAPDGKHIAATVGYGGEPWIVIIDIDSGRKRRLCRGEASAWSPPRED